MLAPAAMNIIRLSFSPERRNYDLTTNNKLYSQNKMCGHWADGCHNTWYCGEIIRDCSHATPHYWQRICRTWYASTDTSHSTRNMLVSCL